MSVVDGRIVVSANPDGTVTELMTNVDTYNDGHWHYITVTKSGRKYVFQRNCVKFFVCSSIHFNMILSIHVLFL